MKVPAATGSVPNAAGAVLTGGTSTRMGRDKALIPLQGGVLASRPVDAMLGAGCDPVVCIGGDSHGLRAAGLVPVVDLHPGEGPLGGVLSALTYLADHPFVVILAGDLIGATATAVRTTISSLVETGADLAVPSIDDRVQWLHGAWRTSRALPVVRASFAAGERSVHRGVANLRIAEVTGVDPDALRDVDSPADLAAGDPDPRGPLP